MQGSALGLLLCITATSGVVVAPVRAQAPAAQTAEAQKNAEADALIEQAEQARKIGDHRGAADAYQRALALYTDPVSAQAVASVLNRLGETHGRLSEYSRAIDAFTRALPLHREHGDRRGEAAALTGIGNSQMRLNQYAAARESLDRALRLYQDNGDRAGEARALQALGYIGFTQDDYEGALALYERALEAARSTGDRAIEATIVFSTAQTYYHLGNFQAALDVYTEVLLVQQALRSRSGEASALASIGRIHRAFRDFPKALDYHQRALAIIRTLNEPLNEATALNNTAHVYLGLRDFAQARALFEESLGICQRIANLSGIASNTNGIGLALAGLGHHAQAVPYHRDALERFRSLGHRRAEADSLGHLGRAALALGEPAESLSFHTQALAIYHALGVQGQEPETLYAMARAHRAAGDHAAATAALDRAIGMVESLRRGLSSPPLQTTYLASVRDLYEMKIDVLMQQGRDTGRLGQAHAFETSERARARGLLDLLAEARTDIRAGADPALLDRERALAQRLAGLAEKQAQLLSTKSSADERAAIAREIEAGVAESETVQAKIRAGSPRYAALVRTEPLALRQVQSEVLDADTVLLEYFLGAERSYVWAVTRESIAAFALPARADIESAAARFYDLAKANRGGTDLRQSARALSDLILAPAAKHLDRKRLAVAADGALHYVPFAALPQPGSASDQPLVLQHEVVNLPSVSTLAVLRQEADRRATASKRLAIVADPVFDANDVRVRRAAAAAGAPESHQRLVRSIEDVGAGQVTWPLPRLLGTRREARAIAALAPSSASFQALDFDATRDVATDGSLGAYQVVHFATHALINNQHPELSGLVLSLVDRQGQPRDGFLGLNDIFNLRLPAELVVLSACQTGLGKEIRGEGLIGLTRGFMYAGAPRLITSLWPVDDKATSELMGRFYSGMFGTQPLTAAAALRQAQIEMWRQKDWSSLYYWAAFGLQGEWR